MFLLKFVIFLLVLFLVFFLSDRILRKIANVEKQKGFIYKRVNKSQKIGEGIILALFFISLIIQAYSSINFEPYIPMILYLVVLNLYRALMEWKYQKESKEYIITLSNSVLFVIFMYFIFKMNIPNIVFN